MCDTECCSVGSKLADVPLLCCWYHTGSSILGIRVTDVQMLIGVVSIEGAFPKAGACCRAPTGGGPEDLIAPRSILPSPFSSGSRASAPLAADEPKVRRTDGMCGGGDDVLQLQTSDLIGNGG